MKKEEIEKLLSMVNKKDLASIKEFLLAEKYKSDNRIRQAIFEEYLRTNKWGFNFKTTPKLYSGEEVQKFTNGVSLYIINNRFFQTNTPRLIKASAKGAKSNHRFEYVSEDFFSNYLTQIPLKFGDTYSECTNDIDIKEYINNYTYVDYLNSIDNQLHAEKFDSREIEIANIILNNPIYYISHNYPILRAESDIGKCYILGYKNK